MSLALTASQIIYVGNDVSSVFPTTFAFGANADITVEADPTGTGNSYGTLTRGVNYTLSGAGLGEPGGNVTLIFGALPDGELLRITRKTPRTQPTSFVSQGEFLPAVHEAAFDREEMQVQEIERRVTALETGSSTSTYDALRIVVQVTIADPPENTFPTSFSAGGSTPVTVVIGRVENVTTPAEILYTPPAIQWHPAGTSIVIDYVSGLTPGQTYNLTLEIRT